MCVGPARASTKAKVFEPLRVDAAAQFDPWSVGPYSSEQGLDRPRTPVVDLPHFEAVAANPRAGHLLIDLALDDAASRVG